MSRELTLERCFPPLHLGCELALLTVSIYFFVMAYDYMVFEEQGFVWHLNVQSHATKIYDIRFRPIFFLDISSTCILCLSSCLQQHKSQVNRVYCSLLLIVFFIVLIVLLSVSLMHFYRCFIWMVWCMKMWDRSYSFWLFCYHFTRILLKGYSFLSIDQSDILDLFGHRRIRAFKLHRWIASAADVWQNENFEFHTD